MNIILIGTGRMGRLLKECALDAGDAVVGEYGRANIAELAAAPAADVAIDFSGPEALPAVAAYVARTGTPLVSGTTGYTAGEKAAVAALGEHAPVVWSANYSLGVAVLARALRLVTAALRPDFDIEVTETHHNRKKDAPSGTAKLLVARSRGRTHARLRPRGPLRRTPSRRNRHPRASRRHRCRHAFRTLLRPRRRARVHAPRHEPPHLRARRPQGRPRARQGAQGLPFARRPSLQHQRNPLDK